MRIKVIDRGAIGQAVLIAALSTLASGLVTWAVEELKSVVNDVRDNRKGRARAQEKHDKRSIN